jgi:hypothetical protein
MANGSVMPFDPRAAVRTGSTPSDANVVMISDIQVTASPPRPRTDDPTKPRRLTRPWNNPKPDPERLRMSTARR